MVKELHWGQELVPALVQVRHSDKTPKTMSEEKKTTPKDYSKPKEKNPKSEPKKPVIAFYKNTEKSDWILFPQVCYNEKAAKKKVHVMTGSELVKCIDVPEELQN